MKKTIFKFLLVALTMSTFALTGCPAATDSDSSQTENSKGTIVKKAGTYNVGVDINAGEYLLVGNSSFDGYLAVTTTKDAAVGDPAFLYNDNFKRTYVVLENGQWINFSRADLYALNDAPAIVKGNNNNSYPEGTYKAGRDFDAGVYIVLHNGDSAYSAYVAVTISPHASGTLHNILYNNNFSYREYVKIETDQYVKVNRGLLYPENVAPAIVKNADGSYQPGMYKVGSDIAAGPCTLTYITGKSYASYSIFSYLGDKNYSYKSISAGDTQVTLEENTYVLTANCTLKN